jgi:hypothetical protein
MFILCTLSYEKNLNKTKKKYDKIKKRIAEYSGTIA